jgi:hypothetical protein
MYRLRLPCDGLGILGSGCVDHKVGRPETRLSRWSKCQQVPISLEDFRWRVRPKALR